MILRLQGYTDLPAGMIAAVVTYLDMGEPPAMVPAEKDGWSLAPLSGDLRRYRNVFRRVGEPWLWFSRLIMTDEALRGILDHPRVQSFALEAEGEDIGFLELDFRSPEQCELSFFGLVPGAIGRGWGHVLMQEALRRAWEAPIRRLWVHTCTLDHPRALGFYVRSGFRPYKRAIEIAEDPRLKGYVAPTAAPQMPLIKDEAAALRSGQRHRLARWAGRRRAPAQ
jgi:GNAT superfamily N-acetyltransferase